VIYEFPPMSQPIRQGDIFVGVPRIDLSLKDVLVVSELGQSVAEWVEIAKTGEPVSIIVPVRPVTAIVATQDCDAVHGRDITLCEIGNLTDIEGMCKETASAKGWKNIITRQARINQKWFYLPPDDRLGFSNKMAVDFTMTLRVPRTQLEELRDLRAGRLNVVADEHFRERISDFFRRYPYDEWYPLDEEELKAYMSVFPETKPFPWQKTAVVGRD
jgi:antitoxin (DNA-binding transcriptional repressor) of toxin-antitoxin stability system